MICYSTRRNAPKVAIPDAILQGLAPDGGLYMPAFIPHLSSSFIDSLSTRSFAEIGVEITKGYLGDHMSQSILEDLVREAINFPAPIVHLDQHIDVLELFHGPTLAFKDFGARFMARMMGYFNEQRSSKELTILVATSGDTGGAVASGFYQVPGINVVILYPRGKVSFLQEKQLTTLGENIRAVQIDGSFDDCQALVKQAFTDASLRSKLTLSSANSINLARLIPQSFYYWEAYKQISKPGLRFVVPSGNFGNLSAGILAFKAGLPCGPFIAATNANTVFPYYIQTGKYEPKESISTLSNAMDVGSPSNFSRLQELFGSTWNLLNKHISSTSVSDSYTIERMKDVYARFNYIIDPHTAVGYEAACRSNRADHFCLLSTAHPAKFISTVESALNIQLDLPPELDSIKDLPAVFQSLSKEYAQFQQYLLD